ncbi:MAG TPA: transglycosylase domain-containing protein, partial [Actinomycetota bacterium]|nr:transglycosylase domain-containing protein [Actinomycetota bacterium]
MTHALGKARSVLELGTVVLGMALLASCCLVPVLVPAGRLVTRTTGQYGDIPPLGRGLRRPAERSVVRAADGSVLGTLHLDQDRQVVPLRAIPPMVRQAVLAVEDARFYEHGALDYRGIARAILVDVGHGRIHEGGSTLTQQYVKNVVTGDQVSLRRKLAEGIYASQLERRVTKDQILEAYLNEVYFGQGVYGIATAAEHYFSRPVGRLTLPEAAALAGTIAAPERLNPTGGRPALERRDVVLDRMAAVGFAPRSLVAAAERQPLRPRVQQPVTRAPYFVDYVERQLQDDHAFDDALGPAGSAARRRAVFEGGLSISTTLDPRDQRLAEQAVTGQVGPSGLGAAVVSVDPATGGVLAMLGGRDFSASKVNLATGQGGSGGFPPGSSFKVFYLVAALEQGFAPSTRFDTASPTTVSAPECPDGYTVHNAEGNGLGRIDLRRATAASVNTYYAQLMARVGTPDAIDAARRMGITTPLRDYCSLVLGTENVTPLELASAYATLADGGVHCQPTAIDRITDASGRPLWARSASCRGVLDPGIAAGAVDILRGVVAKGGTGYRAAIGRPLAGKTGTTSNFENAWFTGFTPRLSTSVWVGEPTRQQPMTSQFNGGPVYGGT